MKRLRNMVYAGVYRLLIVCLEVYVRVISALYLLVQKQEKLRSWLAKSLIWPSKLQAQFYGLIMRSKGTRSCCDSTKQPLESTLQPCTVISLATRRSSMNSQKET